MPHGFRTFSSFDRLRSDFTHALGGLIMNVNTSITTKRSSTIPRIAKLTPVGCCDSRAGRNLKVVTRLYEIEQSSAGSPDPAMTPVDNPRVSRTDPETAVRAHTSR